jgi:hypothetical protein
MDNPLKLGLTILAAIVVGWLAFKLLTSILAFALSVAIPIAVIVGIALVIYGVASRKGLGGGSRHRLP